MVFAFGQFQRVVCRLQDVVPQLAICGCLVNHCLHWRLGVTENIVSVAGVINEAYDLEQDGAAFVW